MSTDEIAAVGAADQILANLTRSYPHQHVRPGRDNRRPWACEAAPTRPDGRKHFRDRTELRCSRCLVLLLDELAHQTAQQAETPGRVIMRLVRPIAQAPKQAPLYMEPLLTVAVVRELLRRTSPEQ